MPKYAKIGHTYCRENYTNEMQGPRSTQNRKCTSLLSENARPTQRPKYEESRAFVEVEFFVIDGFVLLSGPDLRDEEWRRSH